MKVINSLCCIFILSLFIFGKSILCNEDIQFEKLFESENIVETAVATVDHNFIAVLSKPKDKESCEITICSVEDGETKHTLPSGQTITNLVFDNANHLYILFANNKFAVYDLSKSGVLSLNNNLTEFINSTIPDCIYLTESNDNGEPVFIGSQRIVQLNDIEKNNLKITKLPSELAIGLSNNRTISVLICNNVLNLLYTNKDYYFVLLQCTENHYISSAGTIGLLNVVYHDGMFWTVLLDRITTMSEITSNEIYRAYEAPSIFPRPYDDISFFCDFAICNSCVYAISLYSIDDDDEKVGLSIYNILNKKLSFYPNIERGIYDVLTTKKKLFFIALNAVYQIKSND